MKKLFLVPIIFIAFAFTKDDPEWDLQEPAWKIVSKTIDPRMPDKASRINFVFRDSSNRPIHDSIRMSYNGVNKTLFPDKDGKTSLALKNGKYLFNLFYNTGHYEIWTDSIAFISKEVQIMEVNFQAAREIFYTFKPVIYVYPESTQEVSMKLSVAGELGFTYPEYNNGWDFIADHDGTIHIGEKEYDYLFWDSKSPVDYSSFDVQSGFIVRRDSLTDFLETNLTTMGLTPRERQDFITFWCPLMIENESNYIHFMFNEEYNTIATLDVTPKPANIFRVFMVWSDAKDIDAKKVLPQKIESFSRNGFTVVEWGGAEGKRISEVL